jgi:hypothetical protein
MGRRKRTVWVVMHYEIMGLPESPRVDSVQFHVSSSLEKAEEYIRKIGTDSHSWWQVHPHAVDFDDFEVGECDEVYYYSHRETRLKSAPTIRSIAAFRRYTARHPDRWPPLPSGQ